MNMPTAQRDPGAASPTFSSRELVLVIGVPAAWAILLLFHPRGDDGFYEGIEGNVVPWVTVHLGMGIFVPLFAGAIYLLLRGVDSTAAMVSRIGLAVFAIFYAAWELVLGVGTGLFTEEVNGLPEAQQAVGADLVDSYAESAVLTALSYLGSIGLAVAMIGAAVALRRAYQVGLVPVVLLVLAIPSISIHEPPFGPIGLVMFIGAVLLIVRRKAPVAAPSSSPAVDRRGVPV